ncbi:MAG: radical SAM protein, partial [Victivallaceae bacterium]
MQSPNYIFGPVPSRRLGRSLGIDLIPYKICSYDCIYCQLGRTTTKTMTRREYLPIDEIIAGIERKLKETCEFDYITLSGSGEPTLHSGLGVLIEAIKKLTRKPLAVITNGSLLKDAAVRAELMAADVVMPSLDAGTQEYFETVNRPCPGLLLDDVVDGLAHFSREFKGKLWLEVFLLGGSFDPVARAWEIANVTRWIRPSL